MYDVKELIDRLKYIANLKTNVDLAEELNISYNTLNTWIKRGKLPQDILIGFSKKFNISLDYLIFGKIEQSIKEDKQTSLFNNIESIDSEKFIYYGQYRELNINFKTELKLNKTLIHSGAYYLLFKGNIYFISKATIDIFKNLVILDIDSNLTNNISLQEFKALKIGLIIEAKIVK